MVDARGQWCGSSGFLVRGDCRNPDGCSCDQISALRAELEQVKRERDEEAKCVEYAEVDLLKADKRIEEITANRDMFASRCADYAARITALEARVVTDEAADAPRCWWINHGNYGQITQREDEAAFAKSEGKHVIEYCPKPLLSALADHPRDTNPVASHEAANLRGNALAEPAGEAEPSKWSIPGSTYAGATTPPASAIREALERMLKEHDILSGNFGDVMDPKYARPDRWPTAAQKARAALAGAKP